MFGHRIIQTIQSPFLPTTSGVATNLLPTLSSPKLLLFAPMANDGPDFVGRTSLVIDIYGMSSEKQFVNTLEDVIQKGSDGQARTDSARVEISKRVGEILRALCIDDWQSEPITNIRTLQNIVGKSSKGTYNGT
jgi:hypothetical protein